MASGQMETQHRVRQETTQQYKRNRVFTVEEIDLESSISGKS